MQFLCDFNEIVQNSDFCCQLTYELFPRFASVFVAGYLEMCMTRNKFVDLEKSVPLFNRCGPKIYGWVISCQAFEYILRVKESDRSYYHAGLENALLTAVCEGLNKLMVPLLRRN